MKKILYISQTLGSVAGADRSGIDFLKGLLHSDNEIYVLSTTSRDKIKGYLSYEYYKKIVGWYIAKKEYKKAGRFYKTIPKLLTIFYHNIFCSDKKVYNNKYDIIFVNSIGSHEIYRSYEFHYQHKSINILRGSFNQLIGIGYSKKRIKNYVDTYNFIIFVSKNVIHDFQNRFNLPEEKCFYLPNTIDDEKVKDILSQPKEYYQKKLGFDKSKFNIVFVANIMKRKGHDILLNAINDIRTKLKNVKIHLVGRPYAEGYNLLRELQKNKDIIEYHNHVSNPLEYIFASNLLILLSRSEAMPRVILEAMALGIPCLVSKVDGNTELVTDEFECLLFDIERNNLIEKLEYLIEMNDELNTIGKSLKIIYDVYYNNNVFLTRISSLIQELQ